MPRTLVASARRAGAVTSAVALLALTACTGGGETVTPTPDESPTAVVTESLSASPTPTALTEEDVLAALPEGAAAEDVVGVMLFGEWFLENYHELMRTNQALFEAVVAPDCGFCANVRNHYAETSADGISISGGDVVVEVDMSQAGLQNDGTWGVEADFTTTDLVETDGSGSMRVVEEAASGRVTLIATFDGHWTVSYVGASPE